MTSLADQLDALIPRDSIPPCKVCTLAKTLPERESSLLLEAASHVSGRKLADTLRDNGYQIGEKAIYKHRDRCSLGDQ